MSRSEIQCPLHSLTHLTAILCHNNKRQRPTATACSATTAHSRSPVATERARVEGSVATEAAAEAATLSSLCCMGTTDSGRASERARRGKGGGGQLARGLRCPRERRGSGLLPRCPLFPCSVVGCSRARPPAARARHPCIVRRSLGHLCLSFCHSLAPSSVLQFDTPFRAEERI